jgi:hypothetical protein
MDNSAPTLRIAKGLHASFKNYAVKTVEETLIGLQTRTDCYEVLNDDFNRVYGDIDGKVLDSATEQEFNKVKADTQDTLVDYLDAKDGKYALMEACSFLLRKISFRFVICEVKTTKPNNKEFAKQLAKELTLPEGVKIDTGVYGSNQKMRMLGSNKDGENRPLKLVKGDPIDTLISYCPEGCGVAPELKVEKVKAVRKKKDADPMLLRLLDETDVKRIDEYETWIQMGMICYNLDADVSVWENTSSRSNKYTTGECEKKWRTFHKGTIGIATLWAWLKEDRPKKWEEMKGDDYEFKKIEFEKTHFKLLSPPAFGYIDCDGMFQLNTHAELLQNERNNRCGDVPFMTMWEADPRIRTYDKLVFKPKQVVPSNYYNLFEDFGCGVEGDVSVIQEVLLTLCNNDKKVFDYVERWVANIIQNPSEKNKTCVIFQSDTQGAGKDTYGDFIGSILGQYAVNIIDAPNEIFGRFSGQHKQRLFVKFEEAPFINNHAHREMFKALITCEKREFEDKGLKPMTLDCYYNVMMTTNNKVPALLEDKERRMILIKCSEEKVGQYGWWKQAHKTLKTQEAKDAYLYYLSHLDLTDFDPRERPHTDFYDETKLATRPYHARFFQDQVCESADAESLSWRARDLYKTICSKNDKFEITETSLGAILKKDYAGVITKHADKHGARYTFNCEEMKAHLTKKSWWSDFY